MSPRNGPCGACRTSGTRARSASRAWYGARRATCDERRFAGDDAHDFTDPNMATPESLRLLKHARRPIALDFVDDYFYDHGEDFFHDEEGRRRRC